MGSWLMSRGHEHILQNSSVQNDSIVYQFVSISIEYKAKKCLPELYLI